LANHINQANETQKEMSDSSSSYIKEDSVMIGISITPINTIKSLGELYIAYTLANQWIHHETHCLTDSLAVVDVMVAIQIEQEWCICQHSRDTYLPLKNKNT
jgi:hypothetical protein